MDIHTAVNSSCLICLFCFHFYLFNLPKTFLLCSNSKLHFRSLQYIIKNSPELVIKSFDILDDDF